MQAQNEPAPSSRAAAPVGARHPLIALIGNPNTGKTTLFNRLTGASGRVGNYPGITVERRTGRRRLHDGTSVEVVDLPGAYSLTARSAEEMIAMQAVLGIGENPTPDLAVVVVDAGQLVRNFYLVVQLMEMRIPMVVVLNMLDEVDDVDVPALQKIFGVPIVGTNARIGEGIDQLDREIKKALEEAPIPPHPNVTYPSQLHEDADRVGDLVPDSWLGDDRQRRRALGLWALTSIDVDDELENIDPQLRREALAISQADGRDIDGEIVMARYAFLDDKLARWLPATDDEATRMSLTDRVDRVALHPVFGFGLFVLVMLMVFQALFSWADPAIGLVEDAFGALSDLSHSVLPEGFIADLVSEGLISGVGNVVVFLPQILLLFLLMGFLEDSGYMARAAYLMDRIMKSLGLHGRAFVPMLSGCACAIPAIMATRTMERERDRLLTMLVIPLMTCSARLPVYTLIIAALFPPSTVLGFLPVQGLLMVAMYLFATITALGAAAVIGRTVVRGRRMPLLLELPPYRLPTWRSVLKQTFERATVFLKEAGTVILACTIILWGLLSYPKVDAPPAADEAAQTEAAAEQLAGSYGGRLGKAIEPAIEPLGFDWKLGVGIVGAFAAREVFVSTMGVVYGIGEEADEESQPLRAQIRADKRPDGTPVYTPLVGLSLMVFFALACQCMSTLAVVKRETRSYKWPAFLFVYMTGLAWVMSFIVYQGGRLLGFN